MSKLFIFRSSAGQHEDLAKAICEHHDMVVDVTSSDQIDGMHQLLSGDCRETILSVEGTTILEEDRLLFFGVPRLLGVAAMEQSAREFAVAEWHSAFFSILHTVECDVIGLPQVDLPISHIQSHPYQTYLLSMIGWYIKPKATMFGNVVQHSILEDSTRLPYFLLMTRRRWSIVSDVPMVFESHEELMHLCERTYDEFYKTNLVFAIVPFRPDRNQFEARGILLSIPGDLKTMTIDTIARDFVNYGAKL